MMAHHFMYYHWEMFRTHVWDVVWDAVGRLLVGADLNSKEPVQLLNYPTKPSKPAQTEICDSHIPLLLTVIAMAGKLDCVVVAVDGSEESMNALKWALDNLTLRTQGEGSEAGTFVILHVQSPPSIAVGLNPGSIPFGGPSDLEVPAFTAAIEAHQRRITNAILNHALKICSEKHAIVKTQVVVGDPKEMICDFTENLKADLLVMGSHAYGPIKRMFLGSVSNYCTNHVQCPVIVVKGDS
ncbi:PREDICTED: universal stress protein PHOS34 [Nelumbo nucifera]|uniref:Universal stress protein PHOS34 n=1 Tax=Nelumbo nucifera TaxID=4432 RepID=A0A1U8ASP6_NELNU|nr:PREDICTED: universal stress protein PHOS34 [Nelumbo nucifera]